MTAATAAAQRPLVVDHDGTLLRSDLLLETGLAFLRDQPQRFFAPLRWLAQGKAALKHELALATEIDAIVLPYDVAVIRYIEDARQAGRQVVLSTASRVSTSSETPMTIYQCGASQTAQ